MKTITIKLPDDVNFDHKEIVLILATSLYEQGKLSLGQAADISGLSKIAFLEILTRYGVSIINHPVSDLDRDINNAGNYHS